MTSGLDSSEIVLQKFFSNYRSRAIPKGRPLLYQGEIPTMGFFVKSGIVKMYNITSQGEEKIVGYESSGSLLPLEWLFDRAPVSLYYYDTFTECELYRISKEELIEAVNRDHRLALTLLERSFSMYIGATIHLHALEQSKARNKLLYIFQYLVLRFGKTVDKSHSSIDLRLTHQEIANLIGTSRETTSSEIGKLTKEGVVAIKDLKYVVDTDKALRLLGENDFNELSL